MLQHLTVYGLIAISNVESNNHNFNVETTAEPKTFSTKFNCVNKSGKKTNTLL